jgi:hypothetical protein
LIDKQHEVTHVNESENPPQKAIRLINRQLEELQQTIKSLNYSNPKFKAWRDSTNGVLERFLGKENHHTSQFRNTRFLSMTITHFGHTPPPGYVSPEDMREFQDACRMAEETLKAAIRDIEDFGVHEEQPKLTSNRKSKGGNGGGITQTFNAPVSIHNMALAADDAIQKIGHMGDNTGASLKHIADLLQQSEELSPREVKEGLAHIQAVALEVKKPEAQRNWNTIVERGKGILGLADKATDLAKKLAPYTPAVVTWIEQAKHWIK